MYTRIYIYIYIYIYAYISSKASHTNLLSLATACHKDLEEAESDGVCLIEALKTLPTEQRMHLLGKLESMMTHLNRCKQYAGR